MVTYKVVYLDPRGKVINAFLDVVQVEYTRKENNIGSATLIIKPDIRKYPINYWLRDSLFLILRSVDNREFYNDTQTAWFITDVSYVKDEGGKLQIQIGAEDATTLISRRIVAYDSGNVFTEKIGFAEEIAKDLIRENMGIGTLDADRSLINYVEIDFEKGFRGAIIVKSVAWADLLSVVKEVVESSASIIGRVLIFDFVYYKDFKFLFKIWEDYRGLDLREKIIISEENGSLSSPQIIVDYKAEKNYVYAIGKGIDNEQIVQEASTDNSTSTPFARKEVKVDSQFQGTEEGILAEGEAALLDYRSLIKFSGNVEQGANMRYGIDYNYGDIVTVYHLGYQFDARITTISVVWNETGEKIETRLEGTISI